MSGVVVKRRRQLPELKDLFKALLKIPDREVQHRVLSAINGIISDTCNCKCRKDLRNVETQTDYSILERTSIKVQFVKNSFVNGSLKVEDMTVYTPDKKEFISKNNSFNGREVKRRKRTRKVSCVEKVPLVRSHSYVKSKSEIQNGQRVAISRKFLEKPVDFNNIFNNIDLDNISEPQPLIMNQTELLELMKKEWITSLKYNFGRLPLHEAIYKNDINWLRRQIYVLKKRNININLILTEDEETPLELAIKGNCINVIIKELVKQSALTDGIDKDGNTIIHLVMLNMDDVEILKLLLEKVDLDTISKTNDNGLTSLHLAVLYCKFDMCKALLEFIDVKLGLNNVDGISNERDLFEKFKNELSQFATKAPVILNRTKMSLINMVDMKHRRTPIFYAVQMGLKRMTFMLLCNYADPRISDYSGVDCISLAVDFTEKVDSELVAALRHTISYIEKSENI